jgi:hypothetical protein
MSGAKDRQAPGKSNASPAGRRHQGMSERRFGSHVVELTSLEKVLFPEDGIRKQDIIDYYEHISDVMLPHIKDRPLMLQRFPNGIDETSFFQKNIGHYFPQWIKRTSVTKAAAAKRKPSAVTQLNITICRMVAPSPFQSIHSSSKHHAAPVSLPFA